VVHPVWATSTREISRSFLYYYPTYEGIQPTTNPLQLPFLSLTVSYLKIQYSPSNIAAIHFSHKRGIPSREKNPNIMIQVDIGGHPPFPNGSKQLFDNLLFLAVFSGPELPRPF
jgi:hypothetical protein